MNWKDAPVDGFDSYDDTDGLCADKLSAKALKLRKEVAARFPTARISDSPVCRANTASPGKQSIHGDGRALDIFDSKNNLDLIAQWLTLNSKNIQLIIYDEFYIQKNVRGKYRGPNPHVDHIHVEVSKEDPKTGESGSGIFLPLLVIALLLARS